MVDCYMTSTKASHHVFLLLACFSLVFIFFSVASSEREIYAKQKSSCMCKKTDVGDDQAEEERGNPYVWTNESFMTRYSWEEGFLRTIPSFSKGDGHVLRGLRYHSVSWVVANPNTMVVPHHTSVDSILYVCKGKGIIGMVNEETQERFFVKEGDVMVIPTGKMVFAANSDDTEQLCILNLILAMSVPGRAQAFFGIGAEDQESFFRSFSSDIMEAAFNTGEDRLMKLFENHKHVMEKLSREQIQKLKDGADHVYWLSNSENENRDCPYSLLDKQPSFSSGRGRVYEVDHTHYAPLYNLDVSISFANITGGSMLAPSYNSRATKISIITRGHGYLEMACPQGGDDQEKQGTRYERLSAKLSPMTVAVAPAGHPLVVVGNEELHIISFDINSRGNTKFTLAGKKNIFSTIKGVVAELAFGSSKDAEQVLGSQHESIILEGPQQTRPKASDSA